MTVQESELVRIGDRVKAGLRYRAHSPQSPVYLVLELLAGEEVTVAGARLKWDRRGGITNEPPRLLVDAPRDKVRVWREGETAP
jgi:hypothetical protein